MDLVRYESNPHLQVMQEWTVHSSTLTKEYLSHTSAILGASHSDLQEPNPWQGVSHS